VIATPTEIECVECGAIAHLISFLPEDGLLEPGYPVAYRCSNCLERFDLIWEEEEEEEEDQI
jgi:hypothetical protein